MQVRNDLKASGIRDILIACVDGLAGFSGAIEDTFPATAVQTALFT
jgi:putative transposase